MKFVCVMSVNGCLVSYEVFKEDNNIYKAVIRKNVQLSTGVPMEFQLVKKDNQWIATPWHNEIVPGLTHCIDSAA